jgi:hypothetical protein
MLRCISPIPTKNGELIFEKQWKNEPTMMENIYWTMIILNKNQPDAH